MTLDATPFLAGALAWVYNGEVPEQCPGCGWHWGTTPDDARSVIAESPRRYELLLDGRDGMAAAADGGWNATAYLWHLTDLARSWAERWVQVRAQPGSLLVGWDPDVLADARSYRALPTAAALWSLHDAVDSFLDQCDTIALESGFEHADWGRGSVGDAIRWLGHEFTHHQVDVDLRAVGARTSGDA